MPRPISVKAVGKPIMITTTMSPSIVRPRAASLMSVTRFPYRADAPSRRSVARALIDELALRELLLDHVDLSHILEAARPFSGPEADDAAHHLGQALQND